MNQEELDEILQVVENPVRRRIIKRLSQEPCYALQLSRELSLGQPLVAKHLSIMEKAGLVRSVAEASPAGPPRKKYSLARGVSVTMDLGPNVFIERGTLFPAKPARKGSHEITRLRRHLDSARELQDDRQRMSQLSRVLAEVDRRIEQIEGERAELLDVRNATMGEAALMAGKLTALDARRVLFHILDEHDKEIDSISEALNLRELSVRSILEELEKNYFG